MSNVMIILSHGLETPTAFQGRNEQGENIKKFIGKIKFLQNNLFSKFSIAKC